MGFSINFFSLRLFEIFIYNGVIQLSKMFKDSCLRKAKIAVQGSWRWFNIIVEGEASLKKNGKIWGKFQKGGEVKKTDENFQFQFGNLKNLSIFQKCLNFNYFVIILQYYLNKKCLKFKKFWIWSEGRGLEFSPNFPVFFLWRLPSHQQSIFWPFCL